MIILQVNTADQGGGAEGSARQLFRAYREKGHQSFLAVGRKYSDDPDVLEFSRPVPPGLAGRFFHNCAERLRRSEKRFSVCRRLARILDIGAHRERIEAWFKGYEDMYFPGTGGLPALCPSVPDLIHCHNLHGWYFDLRVLPQLSRQVPMILNLRDTWLLTGHCGYFMECNRWREGCGQCPDLSRYPGVRRDATAENWRRKRDLYASSLLYVTAPSQWLLDCARGSMLKAEEYRLIPNGIDVNVFRPGENAAARERLGLPPDRRIVLFAAASGHNVYKDPETMVEAIRRLAGTEADTLFLCLGRKPPKSLLRTGRIVHAPFQANPNTVADYYRAADVFVHTARAEAFGKTVTEAMACGTPVVATAVGGIPEQFADGEAGFLTPVGDAGAIAERVRRILADDSLRARQSEQAAKNGSRYSLERQVDAFLDFYTDVIQAHRDALRRETSAAGVSPDHA